MMMVFFTVIGLCLVVVPVIGLALSCMDDDGRERRTGNALLRGGSRSTDYGDLS